MRVKFCTSHDFFQEQFNEYATNISSYIQSPMISLPNNTHLKAYYDSEVARLELNQIERQLSRN